MTGGKREREGAAEHPRLPHRPGEGTDGMERRQRVQRVERTVSLLGLALSIGLCAYGWRQGVFTSPDRLRAGIYRRLLFPDPVESL